jgi:hypothetical protein
MAAKGEVRPLSPSRGPAARAWVRVAAALFAIGYGANQFGPLMVLYRERGHYTAVTVAAFFGSDGGPPGIRISLARFVDATASTG